MKIPKICCFHTRYLIANPHNIRDLWLTRIMAQTTSARCQYLRAWALRLQEMFRQSLGTTGNAKRRKCVGGEWIYSVGWLLMRWGLDLWCGMCFEMNYLLYFRLFILGVLYAWLGCIDDGTVGGAWQWSCPHTSETLQCPFNHSYLMGHYVPRPQPSFHPLDAPSSGIHVRMYIPMGHSTTYYWAFSLLMIGIFSFL